MITSCHYGNFSSKMKYKHHTSTRQILKHDGASLSSVFTSGIWMILLVICRIYHFHTSLQRKEKVYKWDIALPLSAIMRTRGNIYNKYPPRREYISYILPPFLINAFQSFLEVIRFLWWNLGIHSAICDPRKPAVFAKFWFAIKLY